MSFTNSPLVQYTNLSPNNSGQRKHSIDTITIHCTAGQCTIEWLGEWFARPSTKASSNYGVDKNGKIGLFVEEKNRSWCSSNGANDNRAITIEVASDNKAPYKVSDAAYNALIKLVADICKRNGIKKLLWKADKSLIGQVDKQNMTVHRWFANKACPGDYLYGKHPDIARKVNNLLKNDKKEAENDEKQQKTDTKPSDFTSYKVKITAQVLNVRKNAGVKFAKVGEVKAGEVYTIVSEKKNGSTVWGKLKSGLGFICLTYTKKV